MKSHTSTLMCPVQACPRHTSKPFAFYGSAHSRIGSLRSHFLLTHLDYRQFKCTECPGDARFKTTEKIKQHILFHHLGMIETSRNMNTKMGKEQIEALGPNFLDQYIIDLKVKDPGSFIDDDRVKEIMEAYKDGRTLPGVVIYEKSQRNCTSKYK